MRGRCDADIAPSRADDADLAPACQLPPAGGVSELIRLGQSQAGTPILGGFPGEREVTVVLVLVAAAYGDLQQLLHSRGFTARVRATLASASAVSSHLLLSDRAQVLSTN